KGHMLGVINLVEERFLGWIDIHADDEDVTRGERHGLASLNGETGCTTFYVSLLGARGQVGVRSPDQRLADAHRTALCLYQRSGRSRLGQRSTSDRVSRWLARVAAETRRRRYEGGQPLEEEGRIRGCRQPCGACRTGIARWPLENMDALRDRWIEIGPHGRG